MISSLLIFLCHVFPRKNMFHACAVGKILGVVQVIVCYEEPRKNTNSVVRHFSQFKVFLCTKSCHSLLFLCRLIHSFKYHENLLVNYLG